MVFPYGEGDLPHKYRPRKFCEVLGHSQNVKSIKEALRSPKPPQAYMLVGPSGVGKTTLARIMATALNCTDIKDGEPCLECPSCKSILSGRCVDIEEVNAADTRGIDDVRSLKSAMSYMPAQVKNRVYILDEAQGLTADAQSSLLKVLEDAPNNVYTIICTTNPEKIKKTVINRCQKFKFGKLTRKDLKFLIEAVSAFETYNIVDDVTELIIDAADGLGRNALVLLQQVAQIGFANITEIKKLLEAEDADKGVMDLCFALFSPKNVPWKTIAEIYNNLSGTSPEMIWMTLAGYCRNALIKPNRKFTEKHALALELLSNDMPAIKPENKLVSNIYKIWKMRTGSGKWV